jgi:tellurite resistance-related uncharacterized protein
MNPLWCRRRFPAFLQARHLVRFLVHSRLVIRRLDQVLVQAKLLVEIPPLDRLISPALCRAWRQVSSRRVSHQQYRVFIQVKYLAKNPLWCRRRFPAFLQARHLVRLLVHCRLVIRRLDQVLVPAKLLVEILPRDRLLSLALFQAPFQVIFPVNH